MGDWFPWLAGGSTLLIVLLGVLCSIAVPIAILGGLAYYLIGRNRKASAARHASGSWPSTTGTVLVSTLQVSETDQSRSISPVVVYQYPVNGQLYQGNVIRAGDRHFRLQVTGQAEATVARYPVGTSVTVYYNPLNPAEAALER